MKGKTVGIIETRGLLDAFMAVDSISRSVKIKILGRYILGGGLVTIVFTGKPSAVKSALVLANRTSDFSGGFSIRTSILPSMPEYVIDIMSKKSVPENFVSGSRVRSPRKGTKKKPVKSRKVSEKTVIRSSVAAKVPSLFDPDLETVSGGPVGDGGPGSQDKIISYKKESPRKHTIQTVSRRRRRKKDEGKGKLEKRRGKISLFFFANRGKKLKINDIERIFPGVSRRVLQIDLRELIEMGKILKQGKTRSTYYTYNNEQ